MNSPSEPTTPAPGAPAQPPLAAHRVQLQEAGQTARISIHPPLHVATLAELAHLLEAWDMPTDLKAVALDLTPCGSANAATGENAGGKGLLESRQGRVRERAQTVAQERVLAAMQRL